MMSVQMCFPLISAILVTLFGYTICTIPSQQSADNLLNETSHLLSQLPGLIQQLAPAILKTIVEINTIKFNCTNNDLP